MNGHDAFGINKSYVSPGVGTKGYMKAKDLTPGMRSMIGRRTKTKTSAENNIPGRKVKGQSAKGQTMYDTETRSMKRKISTDLVQPHHEDPRLKGKGYKLLGHSQPNGRGGGILRMNTNASAAEQATTYRHEVAHLTPKRNPTRFFERTSDPKRLGREEGRADFVAHGKKTPGQYPGEASFQRGYNQTQRKLSEASARKKKRTFAVDSKGTAVQKRKIS